MMRSRTPSVGRKSGDSGNSIALPRPANSIIDAVSTGRILPWRPYRVTCQPNPADNSSQPNKSDQSQFGNDPRLSQMRLEAVLLLASTPLSLRKLCQMAHLADATEARTLIRQLNIKFEDYGRAIRVEQVAGGYRLMTRSALAPWLARLGHLPAPIRLSTPMMETLAVVAYRQPVSRADVEAVRGVGCGELLRQTMERDLVRIVGRGEELGRPYLYGTTKRFLQLFGLANIDGLPAIQWQALQDDPRPEDSTPDESSTSKEELVVSTTVAPTLSESQQGISHPNELAEDQLNPVTTGTAPQAVIEDEEDSFYDDNLDDDDDDDDDEWDDQEWDDDDEDLDDDDDLEDDLDEDDDDDGGWEEVDDEVGDEEFDDDDEDWDDDDDDDDEDWNE